MTNDIFDDAERQKKLCHFFRRLCLYSTFVVMAYFIAAVWIDGLFEERLTGKVLFTYIVILVGSTIVQRIFVEAPLEIGRKKEKKTQGCNADRPAGLDGEAD